MKEQLISLKTAKLAKEKGFEFLQLEAYDKANQLVEYMNQSNIEEYFQAPTQSLLQKWLREEHNIIVYFIPSLTPNGVYFTYQIYGRSILFEESKWKETPEEALEIGLQEALKLI